MARKMLVLGALLGLIASENTTAQSTNAAKVGVINVIRVIVECAEGKQANEDYQKRFDAKKEELAKNQKELQDLQQQLQSQSKTLNDEATISLSKSIEAKTTGLKRSQEDAEKEFSSLRNEIFNRIGNKLAPIVQQYAREYNYTIIFDSSNQANQIIYSDPAIEITDDIIKRFDASQISSRSIDPTAPKTTTPASPKAPATQDNKTN
jgi:outer membrane protein